MIARFLSGRALNLALRLFLGGMFVFAAWSKVLEPAGFAMSVRGYKIIPFALSLGALHHLPATRVSIVAMVEVVLASIVAWVWLEETLSAAQLAGGAIVLTGIVLAQTSR